MSFLPGKTSNSPTVLFFSFPHPCSVWSCLFLWCVDFLFCTYLVGLGSFSFPFSLIYIFCRLAAAASRLKISIFCANLRQPQVAQNANLRQFSKCRLAVASFLLRGFFFTRDVSLRTGPPPSSRVASISASSSCRVNYT